MISRVRFEAYGPTAASVEQQLLEFASACDSAIGAAETNYGEMVIERQLTEAYGSDYAFKGRQTLHPSIGIAPFVPAAVLAAQEGSNVRLTKVSPENLNVSASSG